jgi:hypothetical protein
MEVTISIKGLGNIARTLNPKLVLQSIPPAANRAATSGRAAGIKQITANYHLTATSVREKTKIDKAFEADPEARIKIRSFRMSLLRYSVRKLKRGLSVAVRRGTGRKIMKSAFIAKGGAKSKFRQDGSAASDKKGRAVFFRMKLTERKRVGRYPIEAVRSPSVTELFKSRGVMGAIRKASNKMFLKRFHHEYNRRLRKTR